MQDDSAYQLVFDMHPEAMWICAKNGAMLAVNDAALALYGYTRQEFLLLNRSALIPSHQLNDLAEGFGLHLDSQGHPIQVETKVRALTFSGQDALLFSLHALPEANSWQQALDSAGIGLWELELTTGRLKWDERSCEIYGLSQQGFDGRVETWQELLHPDDLERIQNLDLSNLGAGPFHHRVLLANGSERIIESYGQVFYQQDLPHRLIGIHYDVTERQQVQESLRSRDQLLERLTRQVPGMIYQHRVFPDGRSYMPYCSDGIRTLLNGISPDQVREDANFLLKFIHPDDKALFRASIKEAMGRMGPRKLAYRFLIAGELKWAYGESTPEPLEDGSTLWHGYIVDITRQRQLEDALRANEERLRLAQAIGGMGVWDKDLITGSLLWDQRMFELFELDPQTPSDQLETQAMQRLYPADVSGIRDYYLRVIENRSLEGSAICRIQRADGLLRYLECHIGLIVDDQNTPIRLLGMTRDVTSRQLAELELQRSQAGLEEANRALEATIRQLKDLATKAESANQAKSQFLANVSHELRTPLNGVIGMSQLLLETLEQAEERGFADVIYRSGRDLLSLINDLLDFSRIEAGKLELDQLSFSLPQLLIEVSELLGHRMRRQGLEFKIRSPELPVQLYGDAIRLRQILLNLLDNAVKFTPSGSIYLEINPISTRKGEVTLVFNVKDTGIGIPADKLEQIFEPFTQADGSMTRQYGGTGLGLSISRQLVELMGGQLNCQSQQGQGSQFSFTLAFALPSQSTTQIQV